MELLSYNRKILYFKDIFALTMVNFLILLCLILNLKISSLITIKFFLYIIKNCRLCKNKYTPHKLFLTFLNL